MSSGIRTDTGDLRLEWDETGGALVVRDGQPQSYVDPNDPTRLEFDYIAHFAAAIDALSPPGPLRVTHVGGAGLSLARWLAVTRPGSPQIVLEPDEALTTLVRAELPLPRGHRIRVRPQTGEVGVPQLAPGSADVLVLDAYADGRVPSSLVMPTFLTACVRAVRPGGLLLANLADEPGLRWLGQTAATVGEALGHTALVAATEVLKGRRFGNTVLLASSMPFDLDALRRALARLPFPAGVWDRTELTRRTGRASPFRDEDAQPSPAPPDRGAWRVT